MQNLSPSPDLTSDNTCNDDCPVALAASILDGKWTTLIIRELLPGTKRYSELMRGLPGISPKMLAARLTLLQDNNIINKKIYPCVPPKTEYTLTPLGRELESLIVAMANFGISMLAAQTQSK
jgi:DNA-binding HxlR family transcriptional regulator